MFPFPDLLVLNLLVLLGCCNVPLLWVRVLWNLLPPFWLLVVGRMFRRRFRQVVKWRKIGVELVPVNILIGSKDLW